VKVALWPELSDVVAGDKLMSTGVRVMVAAALLVVSTRLVAVNVTVWRKLILVGAVYTPLEIVPIGGLISQLTDELLVPLTIAPKVAEALIPNEAEAGATDTPTGINDTLALALFVASATLVAVTTTFCWLAIGDGAS
jgi:Methylamine utilisation protein MauE